MQAMWMAMKFACEHTEHRSPHTQYDFCIGARAGTIRTAAFARHGVKQMFTIPLQVLYARTAHVPARERALASFYTPLALSQLTPERLRCHEASPALTPISCPGRCSLCLSFPSFLLSQVTLGRPCGRTSCRRRFFRLETCCPSASLLRTHRSR